jgi:hypothetical protein
MTLARAYNEFGGHNNDLTPFGKKGNRASSEKNSSLNEYEENNRWDISGRQSLHARQYTLFILPYLADGFSKFPGQPPQLVA